MPLQFHELGYSHYWYGGKIRKKSVRLQNSPSVSEEQI